MYQEFMEQFNLFLSRYENVQIPNLDEFNNGLLVGQEFFRTMREQPVEAKKEWCAYMTEHLDNFQELLQIAILSILAYLFDGGQYAAQMIKMVRESSFLLEENKYFVYYQMGSYNFRVKDYLDEDAKWQRRMLYRDIYESYRKQFGIKADMVPCGQRNHNLVVFLIGQYLNEMHGPTKTVLDRCEVIADRMGAKPVIINTGEMHAAAGYIPFCLPFFGTYIADWKEIKTVQYRGKEFGFMQCSDSMPNTAEIAAVIQTVRQLNPYCLFQVGDSSLCADLCSNFYPLITIGTVPSSIMTTEGQFLLKGKPITEEDRAYVRKLGKGEHYLQYCLFTSSYKPQTTKASRQQFGIPEDAFTILIVGARLDYEVDERFIEEVLLPVMEQGIVPVFMGVFETYAQRTEQYPLLKEHSVFIGFVDDVLAVNEICDCYVNPWRAGGGTSVVEAMVKKLPPVSLDYGDVALGAGEDFLVEDYPAMVRQIVRLREEPEYYAQMAQKAYDRVAIVTDSAGAFWETVQRIENLPEFQG